MKKTIYLLMALVILALPSVFAQFTADSLMTTVTPWLDRVFSVVWLIAKMLMVLSVIYWGIIMMTYNVKVMVREHTKANRVITFSTRAKEYTDKKTNTPKLRFFGYMGFFGQEINQPPSECIIPYRGNAFSPKKMYDFIRKDGLYYPIQNVVMGKLMKVRMEDGSIGEMYSIDGSGLEINRDYDSEQAIQNTLIEKARAYRNEKTSMLVMAYGLAFVLVIGSFIAFIYSWNQFGHVGDAILQLKEPLQSGIQGAVSSKIGPG